MLNEFLFFYFSLKDEKNSTKCDLFTLCFQVSLCGYIEKGIYNRLSKRKPTQTHLQPWKVKQKQKKNNWQNVRIKNPPLFFREKQKKKHTNLRANRVERSSWARIMNALQVYDATYEYDYDWYIQQNQSVLFDTSLASAYNLHLCVMLNKKKIECRHCVAITTDI